jgi:hypothetical protein
MTYARTYPASSHYAHPDGSRRGHGGLPSIASARAALAAGWTIAMVRRDMTGRGRSSREWLRPGMSDDAIAHYLDRMR